MNKYNVIWIDDEWDKMTAFKEECETIHSIHLEPFRTQKAGMEELDNNLNAWDAVILDAKMFDESEKNEVPKLDGLRNAINHINQLSLRCHIPYFISTGQPDLMDNEIFEQGFGRYYVKERDDLQLIEDLKREIDKSPRRQVEAFYHEAIEQFAAISSNAKEIILDIFESMHYPDSHPDFKPLLYYNQLRQILEYVFRAANKVGIIPDVCISTSDEVNLNQCCHYLCGNNADILHVRYGNPGERIVPKHIQDIMFLILTLGNINSHTTKLSNNDQKNLSNYFCVNVFNSRYIIFSLALQICEIVMWMNNYIKHHQDKEENLKKCNRLDVNEEKEISVVDDELIGIVEFHDNIYHVGSKFKLNSSFVEKSGWLGKKIKIIKYDKNKQKSKDQYPFFAINIQLL